MDFAHVEDQLIRSVLEGDISEDALCYALTKTIEHAWADQTHPDVPYAVSEQRLALAYDASDWWNEHGNVFESLECLRQAWKI
jgi:hypothetical protein